MCEKVFLVGCGGQGKNQRGCCPAKDRRGRSLRLPAPVVLRRRKHACAAYRHRQNSRVPVVVNTGSPKKGRYFHRARLSTGPCVLEGQVSERAISELAKALPQPAKGPACRRLAQGEEQLRAYRRRERIRFSVRLSSLQAS